MNNKRLIKISVVIIICIIGLIVVEVGIRKTNEAIKDNKIEKEEQKRQEQYEKTEEYEETVFLEKVIEESMSLLNSKDIDKIYEKINEDYKEYKFSNDKEKFEEYIASYLSGDTSLELKNYEKYGDKYVCDVISYSNQEYSSFIMLIKRYEDDSYDIIFDVIQYIEKINLEKQMAGDLCADLMYKVEFGNGCAYVVEYENIGKKETTYIFDTAKLLNTRNYEYIHDIEDGGITLKPGEKYRAEYTFTDEGLGIYDDTNMFITFKEILKEEQVIRFDFY